MSVTTYGESATSVLIQDIFNSIFTLVFSLEAFFKIVAYSWAQYWLSHWNCFDFFVVVGSWLDVLVTLLDIQGFSTSLFRIIRIARVIGRVGRLFKSLEMLSGIDAIIHTFISSLPGKVSDAERIIKGYLPCLTEYSISSRSLTQCNSHAEELTAVCLRSISLQRCSTL